MGAASEGGYLGPDAQSFFSSVISGAAGAYIVTLHDDVEINTDMVIQPGQDVRISGDLGLTVPPSWGSGGFSVREEGVLVMLYLTVVGRLVVGTGGTAALERVNIHAWSRLPEVSGAMVLSSCTVGGDLVEAFRVDDAGVSTSLTLGYSGPAQCFAPYRSIVDGSRRASAACPFCDTGAYDPNTESRGRCDDTISGNDWYRIEGAAGDSMAFGFSSDQEDISFNWESRCGTQHPGWISG
jgi:hypothetical protein